MVPRIGDHHVAGHRKVPLDFSGNGSVHRGEHQARRVHRLAFVHFQIPNVGGHRAIQSPAGSFTIRLTSRTIARSHPGDLKPGMILEKVDELLAHHASGAQNSYGDSVVIHKSC
jgi:hypothetical protein